MGNLIADVFVTIKPTPERLALSARSIQSLRECTERSQYRLTICLDGNIPMGMSSFEQGKAVHEFVCFEDHADYTLQSHKNEGLGPTINRAVSHIKSINDWHSGAGGDPEKVAPLIVMCQDDLLYSQGWLPRLASLFMAHRDRHHLGFASGLECVEHPVKADIGNGLVLKDWIRAAQMMGERKYWESLMPIPAFDPETNRPRARPHDGMGSGVDWWLIRNHQNSVCRTGRTCLVAPGLVTHLGYDKSTWLKRELPESDADKERMRNG